jgi:hypothetical protein
VLLLPYLSSSSLHCCTPHCQSSFLTLRPQVLGCPA